MNEESICGPVVQSRRGLLALLWSVVSLVTIVAFITAFAVALKRNAYDEYNYNYNNNNNQDGEEQEQQENRGIETAVTSRAMAFAALWTAVLAALMSLFGTVILGFQSPTGQYYTCCSSNVLTTSPLGIGSFIGALLMFANLTLICGVLFGEFEIRDYSRRGGGEPDEAQEATVDKSSMAFSILCMFLTVLYAGFAALTYFFANSVIAENEGEKLPSDTTTGTSALRSPVGNYDGYFGERFDVRPSNKPGFVAHQSSGEL